MERCRVDGGGGEVVKAANVGADVIVVDAEEASIGEELKQVEQLGAAVVADEERTVGGQQQIELAVILRADAGGGDLVPS